MTKLEQMKARAEQLRAGLRSSFMQGKVAEGAVEVGSVINRRTGRPMYRYFVNGKPASQASAEAALND